MTAEASSLPRMTAEEFLAWSGDGHIGKLELVDGQVRAMSPASGTHSLIQANLAGLIWAHLRATGKPCRVGTEAPIVPRIHANDNVRAPDLAVTCLPATADKRFPDPVLIIEVLSPTNQRETWESIRACVSIPSLKEVLVVDSERMHAEILRNDPEAGWPVRGEIIEAGGTVRLNSIDACFPLGEIYAGTHLSL